MSKDIYITTASGIGLGSNESELGRLLKDECIWPHSNPFVTVNTKKPIDFTIEKVIFNNPATIILWKDGTKTVVKCSENEVFDTEKGIAMAIAKKALGNQGNYYNVFTKWIPRDEECTIPDSLKQAVMEWNKAMRILFGVEEDDG